MPILFHGDTGEVEMLDMAGYPLGLFSDFEFETHEIQMKMGDRLVLYTDGVTDAVDPGGKRFGHKTLMDLIAANGKLSCSELTEKVTRSVEEFMGGIKQRDDIIVSILEIQDDPWIHKRVVFRETGTLIAEVMEALAPYNLEMQTTYAIRLSVDEAVSNAWRHGLNEADDVPFEVSYLISDEGFQLRVRDTGAGFDHESLPDPTVEENLFKSHGRGVFLIRQTMDEVEFNETGNEITILKKFPLPAGEFEETSESTSLLDSVPMLRKQQESLSRARKATGPVTSDIDSVDANTPA
jgi:serine/threonine-protein kinase RsbW